MKKNEEVKEILNDENILDEEALEIRDNLYGLAEISIEKYIEFNNLIDGQEYYKLGNAY
ncbi:hypothetical protein BMS3Abin15_01221 [bacterium BMS3Abin15]|nr:hypothetical protein BMS3Abin15_01221 [bacterium BMS3Abin15]